MFRQACRKRGPTGSNLRGRICLLLLTIGVGVTSHTEAHGRTWHILNDGSGDAPTIQAGVDSAGARDTVLVSPGTYYENVVGVGSDISLLSCLGPAVTIIDGSNQGRVVSVVGNARVEGFTIQNGFVVGDGAGIWVMGNEIRIRVTLVGNRIVGNRAGGSDQGLGGGIYLGRTIESVIKGNTIENNYAGDSGGGVYTFVGTSDELRSNTIIANGCHVGGGGVSCNSELTIVGNLIYDNYSDNFGGGIEGIASAIIENTIVFNKINNSVNVWGAGIDIDAGSGPVRGNIIAFNHGPAGRETGAGISCDTSGSIIISCNDLWGNDLDYKLLSGCDTTSSGNISGDPRFCSIDDFDFELDGSSPCAPGHAGNCGLIGAYPVGCGLVHTKETTWGHIKSIFQPSVGARGKRE